MNRKIFIVNHTHWDREWYKTYDQYRMKLKFTIEEIVKAFDNKQINYFYFDGQVAVIDDSKDILSNETKVKFYQLIKDGKISIGPWYVLPDERCLDEESFFKNLQIGLELANEFGQKPEILYLPDTFGHVSQIPQIAKMTNMKTALIHRGTKTNTDWLVNWAAPNNEEIQTVVLPLRVGYYQTLFAEEYDVTKAEIEKLIDESSDDILIMNGADHSIFIHNLADIISKLNNDFPNLDIQEIKFDDILNLTNWENKNQILGEQTNYGKAFVLEDTISTRTQLKVENRTLIDKLSLFLEPMLILNNEIDNNTNLLNDYWKLLIQNHAHDTICGCSVDQVHDEQLIRYQKINDAYKEMTELFIKNKFGFYAFYNEKFNDKLYVFNNVGHKQTRTINAMIDIPYELAKENNIKITKNDQDLNATIISKQKVEKLYAELNDQPKYIEVVEYFVEFDYEFSGMGQFFFNVELTNEAINDFDTKLENEFYEIFVQENQLVACKKSSNEAINLFNFEISSDEGDTYNYSPKLEDVFYNGKIINHEFANKKLNITWEVDNEINQVIKTSISLTKNNPNIFIDVNLDNQSSDSKIKITFPYLTDDIYADTPFDLIKRDVKTDKFYKVEKDEEFKNNCHLSTKHIFGNNFQIAHIGLHEFELTENEIKLTLLRNVNWLSKRDLISRGGGAGPSYETKKAQNLGENKFNLLINLEAKTYNANLYAELHKPLTQQVLTTGEDKVLLAITNESIGVSSTFINNQNSFRIFNPTNENIETQINNNVVIIPAKTIKNI